MQQLHQTKLLNNISVLKLIIILVTMDLIALHQN